MEISLKCHYFVQLVFKIGRDDKKKAAAAITATVFSIHLYAKRHIKTEAHSDLRRANEYNTAVVIALDKKINRREKKTWK